MNFLEVRAIEVEMPCRSGELRGFRRWLRFVREWNFTAVVIRLGTSLRLTPLMREAIAATGPLGLEVVPTVRLDGEGAPTGTQLERRLRELGEALPGRFFHLGGAWHAGQEEEGAMRRLLRLHAACREMGRRMWVCGRPLGRETGRLRRLPRDIVFSVGLQGWSHAPFDVISRWDGGQAVRHSALAAAVSREGAMGAFLGFPEGAPGAARHPEAHPEVAFVGRLWSEPSRPGGEVLDEVLAGLLPSCPESARRAVHGVMAHPGWQAPPVRDHFEPGANEAASRPFPEFLVYEGVLRKAAGALPAGAERRLLAAFHRQVVGQLRAEPPSPARSRPGRLPARRNGARPATRLLCAAGTSPAPSIAFLPEADWRPGEAAQPLPDHAGPYLRIRLFAPKWGARSTLAVELDRDGAWRELYRSVRFESAVVVIEAPLPAGYRPGDRLRFSVGGAEGGGILYAAIMLEDGVVDLRPVLSAEPPPARTPHGIPFFLSPMEQRLQSVVLGGGGRDTV